MNTKILKGWVGVLLISAGLGLAQAGEGTRIFNIPSQPTEKALTEFGVATGLQVLFATKIAAEHRSPAVTGELTDKEALEQLLAATGLTYEFVNDRTVRIAPARGSAQTTSLSLDGRKIEGVTLAQADQAMQKIENKNEESAENQQPAEIKEEIIVTGTSIRGDRPKSSPLDIYSKKDIERSGATTTEQFIQKLPQNLATRTQYASGSTSVTNSQAVNSIDLRGLGVGTTLVLLNGRRMALTSNGQTADISLIPISAIERIEVLTDGASAIYGSDAIGGVVNFVLRDNLEGAETRLGYASVSDGGLQQFNASQTFGREWSGGNALLSYTYSDASPLATLDRRYSIPAGSGYLTPDDRRHSVLATAAQEFTDRLSLKADFVWSERTTYSELTKFDNFSRNDAGQTQYFANVGVDYGFTDRLHGSLLATYSANDTDVFSNFRRISTGVSGTDRTDANYSAWDVTGKVDGDLLAIPAGDVRFSIGAGYTNESFQTVRTLADSAREIRYAFAELLAPLVSEVQGVPLVDRLELSLAARHTKYKDDSDPPTGIEFGGEFSPKVGLLWAPSSWLALRGTYGESFRAASLVQTDRSLANSAIVQFPFLLGGRPNLTVAEGPASTLYPETARSYTLGFDITPRDLNLKLSGTYFDISYEDRIAFGVPTTALAFANPSAYPDVVFFNPSVAQIEEILRHSSVLFNTLGIDTSNPAAAAALAALPDFTVIDNRARNLAKSELNGFDLNASYGHELSWGSIDAGAALTYIFDYIQQNTSTSPPITVVDTALLPVDLRGSAHIGFSTHRFDATLSVNYVDDYSNNLLASGSQPIESWTTFDLTLRHDFGERHDALDGVSLSLAIQNIFDRDPPFVADTGNGGPALQNPVGFDPINANPLGRFLAVQIAKSW